MRHILLQLFLVCLIFSVISQSCERQPIYPTEAMILSDTLILNPSGYAPLSAELHLESNVPSQLRIRVSGRHGSDSDVIYSPDELKTKHAVPVLGLYAGVDNLIEVEVMDEAGIPIESMVYSLRTDDLPSDYPMIEILVRDARMLEGMTLVSYFGHNSTLTPQRPFIFDRYGDVRWALDFRNHPQLNNFFYDNGIERLQNGNLFFADAITDRIYEVDMMGEVLNTWAMPGFSFHHDVIELPNGNFLVSVDKLGEATVEDWIIEIDRKSGQILTEWDLRRSLDQRRTTLTTDSVDWIHVNGLAYDPVDDGIVVSGRTQGLIKLSRQNEVLWILSPHTGWGTAGSGADLAGALLQPLDQAGNPITDQSVLNGNARHPDFDWAWYQHAPKVLDDGRILLFDNGHNRQFGTAGENYSRAVIYEVNEVALTVQQTWAYGRSRGEETYSFIVSDADVHAGGSRIIMSPGAVQGIAEPYGKVIEVDRNGLEVLFEATIIPPVAALQLVTFHRTERLGLY